MENLEFSFPCTNDPETLSEISLLIRIAVGAIGAGVLVLIVVAIRDRLKKAKRGF